jgi:hypothetical protein
MQFYVYTNTHNTGTARQIRRTLAFRDIGRHNSVVVERVGAEWHVYMTRSRTISAISTLMLMRSLFKCDTSPPDVPANPL